MADKNKEHRSGGVRVKAGVLPGVREIRRPDFTKKAADLEKAEAERVLKQGEADTDAADEAAVKASLEAQESGGEDVQLDESAITDVPLWYVAHTYSGYENKVKINIEKTIENRHLENQIFEVRVPMQDTVEVRNGARKNVSKKMFPGYVLVNMVMNDDTWYVVRNTTGAAHRSRDEEPGHSHGQHHGGLRSRRFCHCCGRNLEGYGRPGTEDRLQQADDHDQSRDVRKRDPCRDQLRGGQKARLICGSVGHHDQLYETEHFRLIYRNRRQSRRKQWEQRKSCA